jgi:hypothetical protein
VLFERTFDPVHVIAVSIWHHGDNPIISGSRVAKKPIRDAAHHLTNVELAHRPLPRISTIHSSLSGHCDERKEGSRQFFGTTSAKPSPASPEDAVLDVSANRLSLSTRQRRSGERAAETRDDALRVFSDEMRDRRLLRAEARANELPVKMVGPLGLCIFPVILGIVLLPVVIRLFAALGTV